MPPMIPEPLIRYIKEGRCVLFAGAGLSAQAGLPTWQSLLQGLIDLVKSSAAAPPSQIGEVNRLLQAGRYLEVAGFCKDKLNPNLYLEYLRGQLSVRPSGLPEVHQLIARIPFSGIVTTNYDDLLERAHTDASGGRPKAPNHRNRELLGGLLFENVRDRATPGQRPPGFYILKAHGDLSDPATLVLTAEDYSDVLRSNLAFNATFSAILLTNSVLFAGYSVGDPDLRLLLDYQLAWFGRYVPGRFALMTGLSSVETDLLWRALQINVIPYENSDGSHAELVRAFRKIAEATSRPEDLKKIKVTKVRRPSSSAAPPVRAAPRPEHPAPNLSIRAIGDSVTAKLFSADETVISEGTRPLPEWKALMRSLYEAMRQTLKNEARGHQARYRATGELLQSLFTREVLEGLASLPKGKLLGLRISSELEAIPWEWLQVGRQFLTVRHPLARAPYNLSDAARGRPALTWPLQVLLIGDPSDQLPGARDEVRDLEKLYHKVVGARMVKLESKAASYDAVVDELHRGPHDIIHFAGHAWYDDQEAYLQLSGGVRMRASELSTLLTAHPPGILILNSHFTSFVPPGVELATDRPFRLSREEGARRPRLLGRPGFSDVAARTGVGAFVGSFGSPSDELARTIGVRIHKELLRGSPIATALHEACVGSKPPRGDTSWLLYSLLGYGDLALAPAQ